MRMLGKTVVVTGAGSGLGRATALRLAAEGARVACADLAEGHARDTAEAASGHGSVINLASIYGVTSGSRSPAYAVSKGGVTNLTRQLALQWAPAVRVNWLCPGHVETPLTATVMADPAWREATLARSPLARFGRVDDVAAAILYLASDEAAFITGVALPVDGGYTAV